jgi:hypothetical protein
LLKVHEEHTNEQIHEEVGADEDYSHREEEIEDFVLILYWSL